MLEYSILNKYGEDILYFLVAKQLNLMGYKVGIKVKVNKEEANIMCKKNSVIKIIELKNFINWDNWRDSLKYKDYCNELYFGVGAESYNSAKFSLKKHIIDELDKNNCGLLLVDIMNSEIKILKKPLPRKVSKRISNIDLVLDESNWFNWCIRNCPWFLIVNKENILLYFKKYRILTKSEILYLFDTKEHGKLFKILEELVTEGNVHRYKNPLMWLKPDEYEVSH